MADSELLKKPKKDLEIEENGIKCIACTKKDPKQFIHQECFNDFVVAHGKIADYEKLRTKVLDIYKNLFGERHYFFNNETTIELYDKIFEKLDTRLKEYSEDYGKYIEKQVTFLRAFNFLLLGINGTHRMKEHRLEFLKEMIQQAYNETIEDKNEFPKRLPMRCSWWDNDQGFLEKSWDFGKLKGTNFIQNKRIEELEELLKENKIDY